MVLDNVQLVSRRGSLSINDGFLFGDFQKIIQMLFHLGKSFWHSYVEIGLISDFVDVDREKDLVELVDEAVGFLASCGF